MPRKLATQAFVIGQNDAGDHADQAEDNPQTQRLAEEHHAQAHRHRRVEGGEHRDPGRRGAAQGIDP